MRRASLLPCWAVSIGLLLSFACDSSPSVQSPDGEGREASEPAGIAEPPAERAELQPPAAPREPGEDWRGWVADELARARSEAPAWTDHVLALDPQPARSGVLRLTDPALEQPAAAPLLLHRLLDASEPATHRPALAAALARTQGPYLVALVDLLRSEADAEVRAALVDCLRRHEGTPLVLDALALALADTDARVRLAAVGAAGRVPEAVALAGALGLALADPDPEVRRSAARSLGYLGASEAKLALSDALASDDAGLRLAALQALDRIDPVYTRGLAQLDALAADDDAKVAAAAQRIRSR
jgi:hypothetical protein